jgi:thymidylate kinase
MDIAFNNPLPDKYFFLRVPFSVLIQRLTERNLSKSGVVDTYEEPTFQMAVYLQSEYMLLLLNRNHMLYNDIIEGTYYTEKGTIKAYKPKEIAFNIYKASFDIK